jgi:hypothetical protein
MEDLIELPDPDDQYHMAIFEDDYMLEPVDPDEPIGPETKFRATEAGGEFLVVAGVLTSWLRQRPAGPLDLDEEAVRPILALLGGWASGIAHAFAAEPLALGEAQERVGTLSPDAVEVRIAAMQEQGLLEASEREDGEVRYAATDWLGKGVAAIAAAARMELRYPAPGTAPIAVADVEAAFGLRGGLLALLRECSRAGRACGRGLAELGSGDAAPGHYPPHRLARERRDPLVVRVVVQNREPGPLRAGGDQQIGQGHRPVLRALGQHRLHLLRPPEIGLVHRHARHPAQGLGEGAVGGPAGGAVEQLQVDDATGGDVAREQKRLQRLTHLGAGLAPRQRALVGEKGRHRRSAPGARHGLRVVQRQRSRPEQQLQQRLALAQLDHLGERRIDRVGQRLGAEHLPRRLYLGGVDLERSLVPGSSAHRLSIEQGARNR